MNIDLRENEILQSSYKAYGSDIEHYCAILTHLSTYFNDSIIVDLGTHTGNSAAALAYNKSNKVYTYDIEHRAEASEKFELEEFKITNSIFKVVEGNKYDKIFQLNEARVLNWSRSVKVHFNILINLGLSSGIRFEKIENG